MPTTYGGGLSFITPLSPDPPAPPGPGEASIPNPDRLLWRWVLTDLNGIILTLLDHLATNRSVTRNLASPSEMSGVVPSDNPEINILSAFDGDPFLSEGNRLLYGFRREALVPDYPWTIRASGIVLQVEDSSESDDATTRFTAYDPLQYLFQIPVLKSPNAQTKAGTYFTVNGWDNNQLQLLPAEGAVYPLGIPVNQIMMDVFLNGLAALNSQSLFLGINLPVGAQAAFIDIFNGVIQECPSLPDPYLIAQGKTVGDVWSDFVEAGLCDVVMEPFYEPINSPGILSLLNIYNGETGASSYRGGDGPADEQGFNYGAVFSWDRPGRSSTAISRLEDGSQRANELVLFDGQGGAPVFQIGTKIPYMDTESMEKYGVYFSQQFFTATNPAGIRGIMADQLYLRSFGKTTVTVNPAPEFSPEPFIDYDLGDRVPVYAGRDSPPAILPNAFRKELIGYQRIVGIPIDIDDNGVETVRELIVGPTSPPVGGGPDAIGGTLATQSVAVTTANTVNRAINRTGLL